MTDSATAGGRAGCSCPTTSQTILFTIRIFGSGQIPASTWSLRPAGACGSGLPLHHLHNFYGRFCHR